MMKRLLMVNARSALLCVLFIFGTEIAPGGTTGKISGRVLDKNKEPLVSVNVLVSGTKLGAATDLDGYYGILNIPPGKYEVQFRLAGYRNLSVKDVLVTTSSTTKIDETLEESTIAMEEVVVTATKPVVDVNLTSTVATITDNDIKMLPVQELQDIVNLQAGVVDGHFRGGRDGEVQYQVNGVSVNNSYDNKSSVKIDRSLIQEVQVITGTFDAEYGQAMSGVVNTVLKSGSENFGWNAEVLGGTFLYSSGGDRNLTYQFRPRYLNQNYQLSVSGPVGIPQTYFLASGQRNVFYDYYYGERRFNPLDTNGIAANNGRNWVLFPNGNRDVVPMSYSKQWSGLARVTNRSIADVELTYEALFNVIDGSTLDDAFAYRLMPDGKKTQRTISLIHGMDVTHTLSSSTFYNVSVRQNYFKYRDWVFDNFYDPRYDLAGQNRSIDSSAVGTGQVHYPYEYSANDAGVDFGRFEQITNALVVKGSLTSQVTREHQFKVGAEFQYSQMQFGTPGTLKSIGDVLYRYVNQPPDYPGVQTYFPISVAAYVQDQIEWNDLTIRAGLRFEMFDARSFLPSDLANPADSIRGAPPSFPRRTTKKVSYAPRLGVSYPITARSSVFFSYGHFYQLPPLRDIFTNANYAKLANIQASSPDFATVYGNPDIKPERTVQYEFGYKNAIADFLGLSINLFYKDIRDLLGVEFISTYNDAEYSRKTNVDFGSVTGFTISMDQRRVGIFSSSVDYTWQMAQGNSSDPNETATRRAAGKDPQPRQVPLVWDQRHTLNLTLEVSHPGDYSISTIIRFGSGQPYTPTLGSGFGSAIEENSGRKPNGIVVDLRSDKTIAVAGLSMSLFVRVFNLFNADYFNGYVFDNTGSPNYGLFPLSTDRNKLADPTRYYAPRRFEIGVSMNSSL